MRSCSWPEVKYPWRMCLQNEQKVKVKPPSTTMSWSYQGFKSLENGRTHVVSPWQMDLSAHTIRGLCYSSIDLNPVYRFDLCGDVISAWGHWSRARAQTADGNSPARSKGRSGVSPQQNEKSPLSHVVRAVVCNIMNINTAANKNDMVPWMCTWVENDVLLSKHLLSLFY